MTEKRKYNFYFFMALCMMLTGIWRRGGGSLGYPTGADWNQYLMGTAALWLPHSDAMYPAWRAPLYPYLLGLLGREDTYVVAAHWLAVFGWSLMMLSAAWLGLLWAGRWAGLLCAFAVLWHPLLPESIHYVNPYPLLGGLCGMAWALASFHNQTSGGGLKAASAIGFGICSVVAWYLDERALIGLMPAFWCLRAQLFRVLPYAMLGMLPFVVFDYFLSQPIKGDLLSFMEKVERQRSFFLHDKMLTRLSPYHPAQQSLPTICAAAQATKFGWTELRCGFFMMLVNLGAWQQAALLPPLLWLLAFVKSGWRFGLWLGGLAMAGTMLVVWSPPRYVFLFLVWSIVVLPIVSSKLLGKGLGLTISMAIFCFVWPGFKQQTYTIEFAAHQQQIAVQLHQLITREQRLVDCTGLDLGLVALPYWVQDQLIPDRVSCNRYRRLAGTSDWLLQHKKDNDPDPAVWTLYRSWETPHATVQLFRSN